MTEEEIGKLTPQERIAGYILVYAKLSELGARLRTKYKDVSTPYYEGWTTEEENLWDQYCDECEPWFYALKKEEKELVREFDSFLGKLCRGENPLTKEN